MKYNFKSVNAEELSFRQNRIRIAPNTKLDIKPQFARQVRKVNGNDKLMFIALSMKIESSESEPKPFDMHVTLVGAFEVEDIEAGSEDERQFIIEGTKILFPYLRAAVTNLTASAYVAPLNLPVINGPIFPEDKDMYAFSVDDELN